MKLTITLRKEVADGEEAQVLVSIVQQKLTDHPDVEITASISEVIQPT